MGRFQPKTNTKSHNASGVKPTVLAVLRKNFKVGSRVELVRMKRATTLLPGDEGTIRGVDDNGTVQVLWDRTKTVEGIIYGADLVKILPYAV